MKKTDVDKFTNDIDRLINDCKLDDSIIPDDFTITEYCKISVHTLDNIKANTDSLYTEHLKAYKKIVAFREHYYLQVMQRDSKQTSGAIFCLKQQRNGGYTDKQEIETGPISITINGSDKIGQ